MILNNEELPDFAELAQEGEAPVQVSQDLFWPRLLERVELHLANYSLFKDIRGKLSLLLPYWNLFESYVREYFVQILAIYSIIFLLWLCRVIVTNRKPEIQSPRSRSDTLRSQKSSNSLDNDRDVVGESSLLQPTNWDTTSIEKDAMKASGIAAKTLRYETWSPPTSWNELSKNLLPSSMNSKPRISQVAIELFPAKGKARIDYIKELVDITEIQIHVRNAKAAVLDLFVHGNETEHTFASSCVAAQFQKDLLSLQIAGASIINMYHSLELVNRGSMAYDGKEPVLHDSVYEEGSIASGVAWDDVYRCLGTAFPKLKDQLDHQMINKHLENDPTAERDVMSKLTTQYFNKRKLLGQIDFFRLFCPLLQRSCKPEQESDPKRLENLVELRKLVARASVYVQSYLRAQFVINKGWKTEWNYMTCSRRMAYDDDVKNSEHDHNATNEYYEATVSRDIQYHVKELNNCAKNAQSHLLGYQTHALIGNHVFQLEEDSCTGNVLTHNRDPIESIPSVRQIVEDNPDLDFFCIGLFLQTPGIASVGLFVRTLPKCIDSQIDSVYEKYANSDSSSRSKMLNLLVQLGPCQKLSSFLRAMIKTASLLFPYSGGGEGRQTPIENGGVERSQFSSLTLAKYMALKHFGGSLQTNSDLPKNYLATTACIDTSKMRSILFRAFCRKLESELLQKSVVDFTFVLNSDISKKKERALCTFRMVHCNLTDSALPTELANEDEESKQCLGKSHYILNHEHDNSLLNHRGKARSSKVFGFLAPVRPAPTSIRNESNHLSQRNQLSESSNDPFGAGVDTLIDILQDVRVPTRRCNLTSDEAQLATPISEAHVSFNLPQNLALNDLVSFGVLNKLNRDDLRCFYQGSGCNLKIAAVRVVNSAMWRGITFPIDKGTCRVELQSGQFFHQGKDYKGNAVFYFRNMCVGRWRADSDAVINAVLHRLESTLQKLSTENSNIKITLVVLLGRPFVRRKKREKTNKNDNMKEEFEQDQDEGSSGNSEWDPFIEGVNPRLQPGEKYHVHSNKKLLLRLIEILLRHYPERLYKAILVPGQGHSYGYFSTAVATQMAISSYIHETRTRAKCFVLHRAVELQEFIPVSQLVTIAGGDVPLHPSVFEC